MIDPQTMHLIHIGCGILALTIGAGVGICMLAVALWDRDRRRELRR